MRKLIIISMALVFILPILACDAVTPPIKTPVPPSPTNAPEPLVGGDCDPDIERVEMNTSITKSVQGGIYPETCEVFCLWVPRGSWLDIRISGFGVDLDIYVDIDLSVLQWEDHGRWESNTYGTGDELVTISNPGGAYYMQVCSFDGVPSDFTLQNQFTP